MKQAWTAELVISAEAAQWLIDSQFPELHPVKVKTLGAGWDNTAYRVNGNYVFRFPRRQFAVPFLEAEARLLPALAPRLPLPVPVPAFFGQPCEAYPWPFLGYRFLPGRTACVMGLDDRQRCALAEPMGRFLAALHSLDVEELPAGGDTIARLDLEGRTARARQNLESAARLGLVKDARPYAEILDAAPNHYQRREDTLVHGDLYARHLLIGPNAELTGVIDWGDAHRGDPALDLAIVYTFLPPDACRAFCNAYGPVPDTTWQIARLRALWHTLILLLYGAETGDGALLKEAQRGMAFLV